VRADLEVRGFATEGVRVRVGFADLSTVALDAGEHTPEVP
jgi:hypothetical protein